MESGLVFNIQKYSLHDGPGIRTTVFLKGCPLQCAWCHNPESISPRREILVIENRCIHCEECRSVCPNGDVIAEDGALPARHDLCTLCGACVEACPTQARQMVGREMSVDQVLNAVAQDQAFFEESKGGVTFSGGEPLFQPAFLIALLTASRARGLHTVVDTCGWASLKTLLRVAPLTDVFLYDVKSMNAKRHEDSTGVSNRKILDNLAALGRVHNQIWVRVPLIPDFNDADEELEAIARFVSGIPAVKQVNLLPFHRTGVQKAQRLGRSTATVKDLEPHSTAQMERAAAIFKRAGLPLKVGG